MTGQTQPHEVEEKIRALSALYTTEQTVRKSVLESVAERAKAAGKSENDTDPAVIDRWLETVLDKFREQGILMSDQQWADFKTNRRLQDGDIAAFIGKTRVERLSDGTYTRAKGQLGVISGVEPGQFGELYTFTPLEPNPGETRLVALRVRQYTPGWLDIERRPSQKS